MASAIQLSSCELKIWETTKPTAKIRPYQGERLQNDPARTFYQTSESFEVLPADRSLSLIK
jgi:hypothetical protein